ncbi:MAG: DUF3592 domain-containing protein [Sandaracinaceae bacterium]|nr:DUF3592 domain-containing protein [Sandaracinaceae bacterium]
MSEVPNRRLLIGLVAGCSLVALLCAAHVAWTFHSIGALTRAEGRIVEIEALQATVNPRATTLVPVAELVTADGETRRLRLSGSSNSPFCCEVGEAVALLYDPASPEDSVRLDHPGDLYGPQAVFGLVALGFAAVLALALRGKAR